MPTSPVARGSLTAAAAALLFGLTTPAVKHFGLGVGPFATATLLYAGAAVVSGIPTRGAGDPAIGRRQLGRVVVVALFGAALAPASLAWGLQHAGALAASLLLNLEAVFTVLLARALHREPIGRRVALAVTLMVGGGALLAVRSNAMGASTALGLGAIVAATLGWALDNTLTRPLADFDPRSVVAAKSVAGVALSGAIALALGEAWPTAIATLALLACGAVGYGASLRLYLRAQRTLGAGRTGSVFAVAPFAGAALSFSLGDRASGELVAIAGGLFALAVYLHATEGHRHGHRHAAMDHAHPHRHDDGHHAHAHDPPFVGEHTHGHHHDEAEHDHAHGSDVHHRHEHA